MSTPTPMDQLWAVLDLVEQQSHQRGGQSGAPSALVPSDPVVLQLEQAIMRIDQAFRMIVRVTRAIQAHVREPMEIAHHPPVQRRPVPIAREGTSDSMKCIKCGHAMTTKRENMPYHARPGAVLVGVPVSRCPSCGEYEVAIPAIDDLDRVLASARADGETVEVPPRVLMGLIRCGEFNEQHGITGADGKLWDDECRHAMQFVRDSGLRDQLLARRHQPLWDTLISVRTTSAPENTSKAPAPPRDTCSVPCRISGATLGLSDRGIFHALLQVDYDTCTTQAIGGYYLSNVLEPGGSAFWVHENAGDLIARILYTCGVSDWSKLVGRQIRAIFEGKEMPLNTPPIGIEPMPFDQKHADQRLIFADVLQPCSLGA